MKQFKPIKPDPVISYVVLPVAKPSGLTPEQSSTACAADCGRYVVFRKDIKYPNAPMVCVHCSDWVKNTDGEQ